MKRNLWGVVIVAIAIIGVIAGGLVHSLNPPAKQTAQSRIKQQPNKKTS
ncbi:hypothetical protein [Secundilactobacillus silagei]|nr:hypothetical protein [Secundilactobacillus silagei]